MWQHLLEIERDSKKWATTKARQGVVQVPIQQLLLHQRKVSGTEKLAHRLDTLTCRLHHPALDSAAFYYCMRVHVSPFQEALQQLRRPRRQSRRETLTWLSALHGMTKPWHSLSRVWSSIKSSSARELFFCSSLGLLMHLLLHVCKQGHSLTLCTTPHAVRVHTIIGATVRGVKYHRAEAVYKTHTVHVHCAQLYLESCSKRLHTHTNTHTLTHTHLHTQVN